MSCTKCTKSVVIYKHQHNNHANRQCKAVQDSGACIPYLVESLFHPEHVGGGAIFSDPRLYLLCVVRAVKAKEKKGRGGKVNN